MGVFKNEVGRPSNKTIILRRMFKVLGLLIIVILALFIGYNLKDSNEVNKSDEKIEEKDNSNESNKDNNVTEKEVKNIESKILIKNDDVSKDNKFNYNDVQYILEEKIEDDKDVLYLNNKAIYELKAPNSIIDIYQIDNLLVIYKTSGDVKGQELDFIDFNGNLIKNISTIVEGPLEMALEAVDDNIAISKGKITLKTTAVTHGLTLTLKDGNSIDEANIPYSDSIKAKYEINDDTIVSATYEFEYYGNNEFSKIEMIDSTSYKNFISSLKN